MIKCPKCGAELNFNAKSQKVECEYCRTVFVPKKLKTSVKVAQENTYEGKCFLCSQCGAELLTFDETAITFCSYCGSQAMIESRMKQQNNPDFIIPFKKTKEECIKAYLKKISKSLFVPSYMKSDIVVNKFRGIYLPYCVYKVSFHGENTNSGTKYSHRRGDYKYYDDYRISADIDADYEGISYDMISNFYDKFSHSIPHDFKEAEPFDPSYLAGFYADSKDVDTSTYEDLAASIAKSDSTNYLIKRKEFRKYGCYYPSVNFRINDKKIGMFPVYFLAIRDKKNTYVNYAVVNGQTGKVVADLPIDFKKYILVSILLAIPIFLLINNILVLTPKMVCIFSIVASIVSIIISTYQTKKIHERQNHLDDIGYRREEPKSVCVITTKKIGIKNYIKIIMLILILFSLAIFLPYINELFLDSSYYSLAILGFAIIPIIYIRNVSKKRTNFQTSIKTIRTNENKISKKEILKSICKPVLAIIIGIIALLFNFVADIYYYGASIIMFILVICSFYDLIKGHNLLVSSKLPQLEKRGGDENE